MTEMMPRPEEFRKGKERDPRNRQERWQSFQKRFQKMEEELAGLFERIEKVRRENVEPVRSGPPLITGKDLITELHLDPGPVFKDILDLVEEEYMQKSISSREEALELARAYLEQKR